MAVVSHEMGFAKAAADRMVFMTQGRLVAEATPEEIFSHPKEVSTPALIDQVLY